MPTNHTPDDAELSRLLNQAEPPKSPEHLDSAILQYAKDNAPETEKPMAWFTSRPWAAAVATLSIAVVAVSVTIGGFNRGELERSTMESAFESDLGLQESLGENIDSIGNTENTENTETFSAAAPAIAALEETALESPTEERDNLTVDAVDENLSRERQVAQNITTVSNDLLAEPATAGVGFSAGAFAAADSVSDQVVEDDSQNGLAEAEQAGIALAIAAPAELNQAQAAAAPLNEPSTFLSTTPSTAPADDAAGRLELANANAPSAQQSGIASSASSTSAVATSAAPQQALRRSAATAVRSQELVTEVNEVLVAPENLLEMLALLEGLMADDQQGRRGDDVRNMDTNERASELLATYIAATNQDAPQASLQQLNGRYAELRASFSEFILPLSLANAVDQVQQLDN